jgi:predicted phosphodiesterase
LAVSAKGESLVADYSNWKYLEGKAEASDPPTAWRVLDFDDAHWKEGRSGFSIGFGGYDAPTRLWGMPRVYPSLFLRKKFTLENTEWIQSLVMRVDYDDGFVAYLNGTEVARRGLAGEPDLPVPFDAPAAVHSRGNPELIDLAPYKLLLEPGENILTVQAHNSTVMSGWFAFHVELLANVVRGPLISATTTTGTKIAWRTLHPTTSVVEYGPTPALGQRVTSETSVTNHVLQLTGLEPGTGYHYRVGGVANDTPRHSRPAAFSTLKPSGPVKLLLLGDTGRGNLIQHKFATLLRNEKPDAVMIAGDIVYPSFTPSYEDFRHFSVYKEHMKSTPYFTAFGNHDLYNGDTAYLNAFHLPTNNLPTLGLKNPTVDYPFSGTEHFYSFDVGDAHVSVLYNPWFSHHVITQDTNQLHWLTNDLATTSKPWKFLLMHFPVASSSSHGWSSYDGNGTPDTFDFGNTIYPIVAKYNVDLLLAGHSHAFEKYNPVAGCISVVSGAGGASPYSFFQYFPGLSQFWSRNNAARILIDGEQLKLEALDPDGEVFDWFVVNRKMPERESWSAAWHTPLIETRPADDTLGNLNGQTFDLIGEPIPAVSGASANLGQVRVNNDRTHLYIGFEQAMIRSSQNIFLFIDSPRQEGVADLTGLGDGKVDFAGQGADGLDYLHNLAFTNFKPSVAAILGDERADKQARHLGRPGFIIKVRTGEKPEDFTTVPFPLGQGVFRLDQAFTDVADARFQQFNRSPQQFSQQQEVDANFIEVAIPYTELGGLQPGDEITIGAVVGTAGVYGNQYRQLDTTHLGNRLQSGKDPVFNLNVYQLEGLKVRLAIDPDPDSDGLLTARELELGTNPNKPDTDGDLLPDGWEVARGLDPLKHDGDAALALDPDGDGMSNGDELAAGTDPLDGESVFTLNVDSAADGIRLHWHAIPGATYQVITAANAAGPYQVLGQAQKLEGQVAAEMDLALPAAQLNQPATFYRLQVTPKE